MHALLILISVVGASPADLQFIAPIEGPYTSGLPVHVVLPAAAVQKMQPDFSDLRIFDQSDNEVPLAVIAEKRTVASMSAFTYEIRSYHEHNGEATIVLKMPEQYGNKLKIEKLQFDIAQRDFQKEISVEVSTDGRSYRPVASDTIFDFSSRIELRRTSIAFSATFAPYVRLHMRPGALISTDGNHRWCHACSRLYFDQCLRAIIRIKAISGQVRPSPLPKVVYDTHTIRDIPLVSEHKQSILELPMALPASQVSLQIATPAYYRKITAYEVSSDGSRQLAHAAVYRLPGMERGFNTLHFLHPPTSPTLRLVIHNDDNPPLQVHSVHIKWPKLHVFFIPVVTQGYRLAFGGGQIPKGLYDLEKMLYMGDRDIFSYDEARLGVVAANRQFRRAAPVPQVLPWHIRHQSRIVATVIVVVCILMGLWIVLLLRKLKNK